MIKKLVAGVFAITCALLFAAPASAQDQAGAAIVVIGEANVSQAGASAGGSEPHQMQRGEKVFAGQVISTGANGHVILKMIDGASVIVRASSRLKIEEYFVDTVNPSKSRIKLNLENGVVRSITGKAGEASKESYRLNTPLAAIGIRGTDFVVFASQDVTKIQVQSGAIVMTRFGEDCSRDALGPCKSSSSRDLTAAFRGAYLELRNRSETPVFVPADKAVDAPNVIAPPRQEEPKVGADKTKATPDSAGNEATRSVASNDINKTIANASSTGNTPKTEEKPVVVPSIPADLWWGKWEDFAKDGKTVDTVRRSDREIAASNSVFGLYRERNDNYVVPTSGVIGFKLAESESYLFNADKSFSKAAITSSNMTIDFGNRRYDTALTVNAPGVGGVQIESKGNISFQGYFQSELNSPNTIVAGTLNIDGSQAAYLFERQLSNGAKVVGSTRWTK